MKYILTKNKIFDTQTNKIIADKNQLFINNKGFSHNKIKKIFNFMEKSENKSENKSKYKSFQDLKNIKKRHSLKLFDFTILIYREDKDMRKLLNKLLINLVVQSFNKRTSKYDIYREIIDTDYKIDFKTDEQIKNIIKILENIDLKHNDFNLNGFSFFKIIANIIALEHGTKKKTDNNSTSSDIKDFEKRIQNLKLNQDKIFSEILIQKEDLMEKINSIDKNIRELEYLLADKLDITLCQFESKLIENNELAELDEQDKKDETIPISLDVLKNLWKNVSKRNDLKKDKRLCENEISNINNIIEKWDIYTSISRNSDNLYLIRHNVKTKQIEPHELLHNFYSYYYTKTKINNMYERL